MQTVSRAFSPLEGVRVLDFSSNIAGPYASMILAQLGADVIKVEPPGGDDSRGYASRINGASIVDRHVGAGKRGVVINLKDERGLRVALELAQRSDVLIQSMRPGVATRLGIGRDAVRELNPEILYYDLNAFGSGPSGRELPGYDPLVQAFSGIMAMTGHDGSPPVRCAPSIIDIGTGQWIALGIVAAILGRTRGQVVNTMETALVDTAFSAVGYQATAAYVTGARPPRAGSGNPIAAPYQCYEARDGFLLIAAPSQRLWEGVVRALQAPELLEDPRFTTVADRSAHREELEQAITAIMREHDTAVWAERFARERVPVGPVLGLEEAVTSEVSRERGTFQDCDGVPLVRLPWLADDEPIAWRHRAPALGEHTAEVLGELGYEPGEIESLIAGGALATPAPVS